MALIILLCAAVRTSWREMPRSVRTAGVRFNDTLDVLSIDRHSVLCSKWCVCSSGISLFVREDDCSMDLLHCACIITLAAVAVVDIATTIATMSSTLRYVVATILTVLQTYMLSFRGATAEPRSRCGIAYGGDMPQLMPAR